MKRVFFYSLILTAAILLGIVISKTPGYVLLAYDHWTLETSLWAFVALLLLCFLLLHYTFCFGDFIECLFLRFRCWRNKSKCQKIRSLTEQGLLALAENSWNQAIKKLLQGAKREPKALINYLGAAFAAHRQNKILQRDAYFSKAHECAPKQDITISLIQARLEREANQLERALARLRRLHLLAPKHQEVLKELAKVYQAQNDWQHLLELIPALKRSSAFPSEAAAELEQATYMHLLEQAQDNLPLLLSTWNKIPRKLLVEKLTYIYAKALINLHQDEHARNEIQSMLDKKWDDALCRLYFSIKNIDPQTQFQYCKRWIKKYKDTALIYLYAGRIAMKLKKWDIAEEYLAESICQQKTVEGYNTFAELYEHQNEVEKALEMYKMAAQISLIS